MANLPIVLTSVNNYGELKNTAEIGSFFLVYLYPADEFIFTLSASTGLSVTLPLLTGLTYNASVDWGDTTTTSIVAYNSAGATHTYTNGGYYDIKISGTCQSFCINNGTLRFRILQVKQWGNCDFRKIDFYGCTNLMSVPSGPLTGMPNIVYLSNFLRGCTNVDFALEPLYFKETPNVIDFSYAFQGTNITGNIPSTFFSFTTGATTFSHTFDTSKVNGAIPSTLFSYTPNVTDFSYTFASTLLSSGISSTLFSYCPNVRTFNHTFYASPVNGNIPANLFSYQSGVTDFSGTFQSTSVTGSIPYNLFQSNTGVTDFSYTFASTALTGDIPAELFSYCPNVLSFNSTFSSCTLIGTGSGGTGYYTQDLFKYNPKVTDFGATFQSTWGLTTGLTDNLFMYNPAVTSFSTTFGFCATLRSPIPEDLFRYNTGVTSFFNTFNKTYEIQGNIPAGLFRYNTKVTTFGYCFSYGGNGYDYPHGGIGGQWGDIPVDLFANCPDVNDFNWTFRWNTGAQKAPNGLFRNNLKVTQFINCFNGAQNLSVEQYVFSSGSTISGITQDQAAYNRFSGKTINVSGMFYGGFSGTRFAPELWDNTKYNMVADTHTQCFLGGTYSNDASIPSDWRI